jgi:hypothetical protein
LRILHQAPNPRRRERQLLRFNAERGERRRHGVSDRRRDRHDAGLACSLSCRFSVRAACAQDVVEELMDQKIIYLQPVKP